ERLLRLGDVHAGRPVAQRGELVELQLAKRPEEAFELLLQIAHPRPRHHRSHDILLSLTGSFDRPIRARLPRRSESNRDASPKRNMGRALQRSAGRRACGTSAPSVAQTPRVPFHARLRATVGRSSYLLAGVFLNLAEAPRGPAGWTLSRFADGRHPARRHPEHPLRDA